MRKKVIKYGWLKIESKDVFYLKSILIKKGNQVIHQMIESIRTIFKLDQIHLVIRLFWDFADEILFEEQ